MTLRQAGQSGNARTLDALLQLREIQRDDVGMQLRRKQAEVTIAEREVLRLRKRRDNVIRRGGGRVLDERLLLDALMKILLERQAELSRLKCEATALLNRYLESSSQRDAVRSFRSRRESGELADQSRKRDQVVGDQTTALKLSDTDYHREEPCED